MARRSSEIKADFIVDQYQTYIIGGIETKRRLER